MGRLFTRVYQIQDAHQCLAVKPYGMIEAQEGRLSFIQIRPFPKMVSLAEAAWIGGWTHKRIPRNRVQVFYNQPAGHRNFLVAKYAVSELGTT